MKKFLSLVLALVMTMSLVTVSAGAKDFTDDSSITYKEAVDVMSAIGVIDGYTDGSFNPSNTLTRGAAAKIICNLLLGSTAADALAADAAPYSDVPVSNVFAGYIAYCAKEGIISGYADGTFRPANTLTGYAFMKMLLGALGLDAEVEGYTGSNWSIAVAKRALSDDVDLTDGLVGDFNGTKAVTREEACLYALNMIQAKKFTYDTSSTIVVGNVTVKNTSKASQDGNKVYYKDVFSKLDGQPKTDSFGRPATKWTYDKKEVGTYADSADQTYYKNVKAKDICKDLDLDKADYYSYAVVVDGDDTTYGALAINKDNDTKVAGVNGKPTVGNGSLVEVYKDEQRIVVINEYLMQVSGDYNTSKDELTLASINDVKSQVLNDNGKLSADDFTGLKNFKDEDYVLVTVYKDGSNYTVDTIKAAPTAVAAVTDYVSDDTVTAGGTTYKFSSTADASKTSGYTLKDEYTLYLDSQGNVIWADGVTADDDVVFIDEFYKSAGSVANAIVYAHGYFLDGSEKELTLNKVAGTKAKDLTFTAGTSADNGKYNSKLANGSTDYATGWYKYSLKSDGTYDLTVVSSSGKVTTSATSTTVVDYSNNKTAISNGTNTYRGNADTKFVVVKTNGDVVTYTGIKNVDKIEAGVKSVIAVIADGSYAKQVFVELEGSSSVKGSTNNSDVIFVTDKSYKVGKDTDDDTYYRYDALVNGVETTIKTDVYPLTAGTVYGSVSYTADKKYVDDAKAYVNGSNQLNKPEYDDDDAIVFYGSLNNNVTLKKQTLNLGSTGSFYMADNAKVFVYTTSSNDFDTYTASQFVVNYKNSTATVTAVGILNADGEVTALYVTI